MKLYEDLKWRGLINDITSPELIDKLNEGGMIFYVGVDPTGDSLHIGHFLTVIAPVKRLKDAGHNPIIIAGGGTGLIGDPKPNIERPMITKEAVKHNIECIKKQVSNFLHDDIIIINNADWLLEINAIDFLRDYGKHFNINYMINKDTVKRRLDIGITYTEFSYMILQSIDFLKLYEKYNCTLQIGGQDQWGNITSGLELIRKVHGDKVKCYGLTVPLVTKSDGSKFGKTEKGESLWLDKEKTSPYKMYQYFINSEDVMVIDYLKKLTFLSKEEIEKLEQSLKEEPEKRLAQKALAYNIVKFLHGEEEAENAKKTSEEIFSGTYNNMPTIKIGKEKINILELLIETNIAASKSEAKRLVVQGGIKINDEKIFDEKYDIALDKEIVLQKGKKTFVKIEK